MTVTIARVIGSTTFKVDTVANLNSNYIGTAGTVLPDGTLDPATTQVFFGHVSGADLVIDSFAPGYTDKGNAQGDVVLVKPTTAWADNIADILTNALNGDGKLKIVYSSTQPAPDPDGNIILYVKEV
jgi:hypothetical protein